MVMNIHPIFSQALVGLFIQIAREGDEILFRKSHHGYPKVGGVEFAHVSNGSFPLIEGVLEVKN